jgi:hypothetical protein
MSNDLGNRIQQIAHMLDQEDLPENMKELVALLASSLGKDGKAGDVSPDKKRSDEGDGEGDGEGDVSQQGHNLGDISDQKVTQDSTDDDTPVNPESSVNPEIVNMAVKAMDRIKSANDPRVNLLQAIKPFMNTRRQKKIGNCIQLLQLTSISKLLNDRENRGGD